MNIIKRMRRSVSLGFDYYLPCQVPEVVQKVGITGTTTERTARTSLSNMSYQLSTLYVKLKGYIKENWYLGAIVQTSVRKLVGSGWEDWFGSDVSIRSVNGLGFSTGVNVGDMSIELSALSETLSFSRIPTDYDNPSVLEIDQGSHYRISLSLGYCFGLSATLGPRSSVGTPGPKTD